MIFNIMWIDDMIFDSQYSIKKQ